jgi:hypothetical protein
MYIPVSRMYMRTVRMYTREWGSHFRTIRLYILGANLYMRAPRAGTREALLYIMASDVYIQVARGSFREPSGAAPDAVESAPCESSP